MDKSKMIRIRLLGHENHQEITFVGKDQPTKATSINGWSEKDEELKNFGKSKTRRLVNLQEKVEIEGTRKVRQRSAKRVDRKDSRPTFEPELRIQHKNPFMNDLYLLLDRHQPSTILHYRKNVTQKLISLFNFENNYNSKVLLQMKKPLYTCKSRPA